MQTSEASEINPPNAGKYGDILWNNLPYTGLYIESVCTTARHKPTNRVSFLSTRRQSKFLLINRNYS